MANYYDELLKLCGFEIEEINKQRPRIEKAFKKLEIGPEDTKRAESFVRQNHDVQLVGMRKILGIWLKELIDLILAKDEGNKVVYFGFPSIGGLGMTIAAASEQVHCSCPDVVICHTMGQIFNKINHLFEAGEANGLPAGHGLCGLQQLRVGAMAKGVIPVPDMAILSSYYCDMGSKTDDLLRERYGFPSVIIDGSMDSRWGEFPSYLPERVEFLGGEINEYIDRTKEILGIEITEEASNRAMSVSGQFFGAMRQLGELMKADPVPISQVEIGVARYLLTGCTGKAMTEGPQAIATLIQEVKKRVDQGIGVVEKGAPRVVISGTSFSDPTIGHMIEDLGLAVPVQILMAPLRMEPWQTSYTTFGEKKAEMEMKVGQYHGTYAFAKRWAEIIEDLNVDGAIWGYLYVCRPVAITSHIYKKYAEEVTGVPCLALEYDLYDSRSYSAAFLRSRVEPFAEILRARKSSS